MAPTEPKKRVKSIKKPGDNPKAKLRKPRRETHNSKNFMSNLLKRVLPGRANRNVSLPLIYDVLRTTIKAACESMPRRHRKITLKDAHIVMAETIPQEVAMGAIGEFRHTPGEKAVVITVEDSPADE